MWLAKKVSDNTEVALKVFRDTAMVIDEENRIAFSLQHPNIVATHHFYAEPVSWVPAARYPPHPNVTVDYKKIIVQEFVDSSLFDFIGQ